MPNSGQPGAPPPVDAPAPPPCICLRLLARFPQAARAAVLLALALAVAALGNAANPMGIRWLPSAGGRVGIPRAFESRLPEIGAREAYALWQVGEAIFVDARDRSDYHKDHIPRAINIPMREWHEVWQEATAQLPRDAELVLYCYGFHCGLSTRMGKRLLELGYERPIVLRRGWAEWTEAGYPTVRSPKGKGR